MGRKQFFLCAIFWCAMISPMAIAAKYEIIFEEGKFNYDPASSPEDVDNKYLASVTVKKDGNILVEKLRGSTLPDAWVFYQYWNVELKNTQALSDADITSIFEHFETQTKELHDSNAKIGTTRLADIADILDVLNRVPAIKSGNYQFKMGLHKNGQSVHGKPYAPRLLGGPQNNPYDSANESRNDLFIGGYIRTLNKNNTQSQRKIAAGINVHDGRNSRDYKDSEGCLTIRPADWEAFYKSLPSPADWEAGGHTGVVTVRRYVAPAPASAPAAPSGFVPVPVQ